MTDDKSRVAMKVVAARLGITENALRLRRLRGTSPVKLFRVGGRLFANHADIEEFYLKGGWDSLPE